MRETRRLSDCRRFAAPRLSLLFQPVDIFERVTKIKLIHDCWRCYRLRIGSLKVLFSLPIESQVLAFGAFDVGIAAARRHFSTNDEVVAVRLQLEAFHFQYFERLPYGPQRLRVIYAYRHRDQFLRKRNMPGSLTPTVFGWPAAVLIICTSCGSSSTFNPANLILYLRFFALSALIIA